jgi:hypothetical protein
MDTILRELQSLGLDKNDCHGNGANMSGVNSGVKTKILATNSRYFFTGCGCHNCNLLLGDATKSSRMAISFFFGLIQRICILLQIFEEVGDLNQELEITLKPLSET